MCAPVRGFGKCSVFFTGVEGGVCQTRPAELESGGGLAERPPGFAILCGGVFAPVYNSTQFLPFGVVLAKDVRPG